MTNNAKGSTFLDGMFFFFWNETSTFVDINKLSAQLYHLTTNNREENH